jgi:hypothetical protein
MNFQQMYEKVKNGCKARRTSWKEGEYLFWTPKFLVHNEPYHIRDIPVLIGSITAFYYVVEKDDPVALDWEVIN